MISVDNVTVSYGGWDLFSEVSLLINPRDRIGLVGKNGAGKTTLLKIITGQQVPTGGVVSKSDGETIGYLPQQMKVADTTSLVEETAKAFGEVLALEAEIAAINEQLVVRTDYESDSYSALLHRLTDASDRFHILGGETRDADIERTLLGLGFRREDFGRPTREFSGGWRMRIELAKLLLSRPSVFLLDEPTNHLDIESIQWLEGYLRDYSGAVLVISHDRTFLDNVTNRTVEISLGKLYDYKVPYSRYVELRCERREQQMAAYANQQKLIEKTEEFIEKFRYKPTKSNQVQSRVKQLEKLERLEVDEEDTATLNIKFPPAPRSGQVVAEIKEVGKTFPPREGKTGEKHVFSGANFTIERGEKIALVGRNGEGKTTLARMLIGEIEPTEGSIRVGANVNTGYYAQNQDDLMDGNFTVYDTLDRVAVGDIRTRLRDILAAFLFRGDDIDKKVKVLSGGERSRLAMARLMLEPYNLLVLDEPTNHMDMRSKDILKRALMKYDGTVVVVSHDREFLDGLIDKVYEFRDGGVREYLGDIWYFLEKRRLESLREVEAKAPAATVAKPSTPKTFPPQERGVAVEGRGRSLPSEPAPPTTLTPLTHAQRKEASKEVKRIERAIAETENRVAAIEAEVADWDLRLADPAAHGIDVSDGQVFAQYEALKKSLVHEMHEWEKLNYELELMTTPTAE
jgi:ATP-binding cassette subfamily F protein 3